MATFEEELKRIEFTVRRLTNFALLGKKVEVRGRENIIKQGPNIITGNHIGSFKDIAILFKIMPRFIFFTANKMIFSKDEFNFLIRKHLRRHLKSLGSFLDLILKPLKFPFVSFITNNIAKIGTIPADLYHEHGKKLTMKKFQDYLKQGRAIIILQGRGRIMKNEPNPYVCRFKRSPSIIAYHLYQDEGISVPVTPLAILGTHFSFMVPVKIKVNVGSPMYVKDYLTEKGGETIEKFKNALEARVKTLFLELLKH